MSSVDLITGIDEGDSMASEPRPSAFVVVMGVSGTGKSTLGSALATALGMSYVEGDDLHPRSNVDKMAAGIPLNDLDREPWLELIRTTAEHIIVEQQAASDSDNSPHGVVITCSALKKYYRDILRGKLKPASNDNRTLSKHLESANPQRLPTYFVFIDGKREVLMDRMAKRAGHFMKATMLDSQLNTLENPAGEEGVVVVSNEDSTEHQVKIATEGLVKLGLTFGQYNETKQH